MSSKRQYPTLMDKISAMPRHRRDACKIVTARSSIRIKNLDTGEVKEIKLGMIAPETPLAKAVIGQQVDATVMVRAPKPWRCRILKVHD